MAKTLVVVESPAKAKTIEKYLGRDYMVRASYGHIRDLPKSKLGVDTEHGFTVEYVVPDKSTDHVAALRKAMKSSTEQVYAAFDARGGESGYDERRGALLAALEAVNRPRDLAALPPNDLASSPLARELVALGAFRADVTGAGPTVYGLFLHGHQARAAQKRISPEGRTWLTAPAWYR